MQGDLLTFAFSAAHSVFLLASQQAYDDCSFAESLILADVSHGGGVGELPNLFEYVVSETGVYYFACGAAGHCEAAHKVASASHSSSRAHGTR